MDSQISHVTGDLFEIVLPCGEGVTQVDVDRLK